MTATRNSNSSKFAPPQVEMSNYALISVPTIESILRGHLQVPSDDTSLVKLRRSAQTLTDGTSSLTTARAKLLGEIFIDGCARGLQVAAVSATLFPNGLEEFDTIYKKFMGRLPTQEESEALLQLTAEVSVQVAPAAVCGAILMSIDPLNKT